MAAGAGLVDDATGEAPRLGPGDPLSVGFGATLGCTDCGTFDAADPHAPKSRNNAIKTGRIRRAISTSVSIVEVWRGCLQSRSAQIRESIPPEIAGKLDFGAIGCTGPSGATVASEFIVAWRTAGPVWDGLALVPALLGGLIVGLVVEVVTRYLTGGTYTGHAMSA